MVRKTLLIGLVAVAWRALGDIPTVPHVELGRYAGVWYEIARIPQPFEAGCRCVQAEYTVKREDQLGVVNTCRRDGAVSQAVGTATVVERSAGSKLSVQFPPHPAGEVWIVALDSNYRHAMISNPTGTGLWILARTRTLDAQLVTWLLEKAASFGIDISKVERTDQKGC